VVIFLIYFPGSYHEKFLENTEQTFAKTETIFAIEEKEILLPKVEFPNDLELVNLFRGSVENKFFRLCDEGVGGTYFIESKRGKKFAVFKPSDEKSGMENNPKGEFVSRVRGVPCGEGYLREIAAYMLDHDNRARVPFTQCVEEKFGEVLKKGSLQKFIENEGSMADFGNTGISVDNVHNIGQLDIRLYNLDRNEENLLVVRGNEIVPIDHSFSLPTTLGEANFIWLNWKQAKVPFTEDMINYVNKIDIENDARILRSLKISEESIEVMKLSTMVLKRGVAIGWNLHQIGSFLIRPHKELSPLEIVVEQARSKGVDFWYNVEKILTEKMN